MSAAPERPQHQPAPNTRRRESAPDQPSVSSIRPPWPSHWSSRFAEGQLLPAPASCYQRRGAWAAAVDDTGSDGSATTCIVRRLGAATQAGEGCNGSSLARGRSSRAEGHQAARTAAERPAGRRGPRQASQPCMHGCTATATAQRALKHAASSQQQPAAASRRIHRIQSIPIKVLVLVQLY
jgi:hypothetical protein